MHNNLPIGIFDSGIGGLTVYRQLRNLMPGENFIYFGDTARAPYGSRPKEQVYHFVDEIMKFMSLCNIKVGVVACNTITVLGTNSICENYNFDLIGNSLGAVEALASSKNKRIGVIATNTTIQSGKHRAELVKLCPEAKVFTQACPKFAPLIEAGHLASPDLQEAAYYYLQSFKAQNIDTLILACTHYPYITPLLQEIMGEHVMIIDPARETSHNVKEYLTTTSELNPKEDGCSRFYFSANPESVQVIANTLFDTSGAEFQLLDIDQLTNYCKRYFIPLI